MKEKLINHILTKNRNLREYRHGVVVGRDGKVEEYSEFVARRGGFSRGRENETGR